MFLIKYARSSVGCRWCRAVATDIRAPGGRRPDGVRTGYREKAGARHEPAGAGWFGDGLCVGRGSRGVRPTPDFTAAYGCDHEKVIAGLESIHETGRAKPRVGWDVCEVLARTGNPVKVDVREWRYGYSVPWWCGTVYDDLWMVKHRAG